MRRAERYAGNRERVRNQNERAEPSSSSTSSSSSAIAIDGAERRLARAGGLAAIAAIREQLLEGVPTDDPL